MSDSVSASVVDLATLSAEDFETLAGQIIRVHAADGALDCVLESVQRNPFPSGRAQGGFSLQLLGPLAPAFQQGQHQFDHPAARAAGAVSDADGARSAGHALRDHLQLSVAVGRVRCSDGLPLAFDRLPHH
jgi:hypothetical protein